MSPLHNNLKQRQVQQRQQKHLQQLQLLRVQGLVSATTAIFPLITLPSLLAQLGFFGIPLVLSVIMLQIYTSFLLSKCWTMAERLDASIVQKSRYPYAAIADLAYGPYLSLFVTILLDLSIFAMGIPNLVVASENLELVVQRISDDRYTFSFCYWVIIVGLFICPLMWLGSPKHMRSLAILSVCVVIIIVILLWFCLFNAAPLGKPFEGISLDLPPFLTVLNGYSVLAFQFDIHPMLLTLQIDMQQKSQVRWAAFGGIIVTCSIAIFGSIIAAYKFGTMIAENILETLPKSVPLVCLLILMALQLCFSTIVGSSALFLQIENYFRVPDALSLKRIGIRSFILALELLIAEFIPDFDVLMGVVGGTISGPLVFILPPLLYRRISRMVRTHQRIATEAAYGSMKLDLNYDPMRMELEPISSTETESALRVYWQRLVQSYRRLQCNISMSLAVLVFGLVATFFSTYLNIFKISNLFRNNSPCFGNLTQWF
ncbi:amino acid transporter AVT1C-like [Teleopsis dalmanni]|uniref:amino acid transporter AVT1C-like n=1 Tax=Teleopsis dalmanni TaxID=139649 RepID=UPI0018CF27DD|nr:amino acid transporter AVT1C-like [Teleopsis dalmanni]